MPRACRAFSTRAVFTGRPRFLVVALAVAASCRNDEAEASHSPE